MCKISGVIVANKMVLMKNYEIENQIEGDKLREASSALK